MLYKQLDSDLGDTDVVISSVLYSVLNDILLNFDHNTIEFPLMRYFEDDVLSNSPLDL